MHEGGGGWYHDPEATAATPIVEPPRPRVLSATVEPSGPPAHAAGTAPPAAPLRAARPGIDVGNPFAYTIERIAALLLDLATVTFVVTTFAYAFIAINPFTGLPTNSERGFDATVLLGGVVAAVYVWLAEGLLGTTLWKLAFGLHVTGTRGRGVGLGRAFVRNLIVPFDVLLIGPLLMLLPGHRRLGDLAAGTIVTRSPLGGLAPLLGLVAVVIVLGLPWVTVGPPRTFATLFAAIEFLPRAAAHLWQLAQHLVVR